MNFVAQFKNYVDQNLVASTEEVIVIPEPVEIPEVVVPDPVRAPIAKDPIEKNAVVETMKDSSFAFQTDRIFIPGEEKIVKVHANLVATAGIEISSTLRHLADIEPRKLHANDFNDGVAEVRIKTDSENTFKLVASGDFGEVRSKSLRAQIFSDVPVSHSSADAIKYLKEEGIVQGYPDGKFKPDETLNRAEAVKILLTGNNINVQNGSTDFSDVKTTDWFSNYIATAVNKGIVKGYGDGQFKPGNKISRAEFLKVAILTAEFEVNENLATSPYRDVQGNAWFAPYFAFAKTYTLIGTKRGGYMVPSQPITRAEAAEVMFKLSEIR